MAVGFQLVLLFLGFASRFQWMTFLALLAQAAAAAGGFWLVTWLGSS